MMAPRFDEVLVRIANELGPLLDEPSEEKRERDARNWVKSTQVSEGEFQRFLAIFLRAAKEASPRKRLEIFLESILDTNTPLSTWQQIAAFDSAAVCEKTKQRVGASAKNDLGDLEMREWTDEVVTALQIVIRNRWSRCVPVSVVYPSNP